MKYIRTADFQRVLRRIHLEKLSGCLQVHYQEGFKIYRGRLSFDEGELIKVRYLHLKGQAAMDELCRLELSHLSFNPSRQHEHVEDSTPTLASYVGGSYREPGQRSFLKVGEDLALRGHKLMRKLYGHRGEKRLSDLSQGLAIEENPSLFIDYCEELAELMLARPFARQLISSLYE
ncbi:MAG: hypothetical protein R2880_03600 [Deinococcales bacterium]